MFRSFNLRPSSLPLLLLLLLLLSQQQHSFTHAIDLPSIRYDAVGQLGFAGDYAGISPFKNHKQFESIPDPGAILLHNNDTYELLGTTSDGDIFTTCIVPTSATNALGSFDLYIGGSFMTLNNTRVNRIARYNQISQTFDALAQGLDGAVYALYCDSDTVYVGGDFAAPMGVSNDTLASFGGHVAMWHINNQTWGSVPWKGFNGPVYTITPNKLMNTILFGGRFEATGDGHYFNDKSSQSVNMNAPTQVSSGNGAITGNFSDPNNAICQSNNDNQSQPWLLQEGVPGYWDASFGYPIQSSMFRISNVKETNHGTKSFSIIALGTNEYFELSYIDPSTQQVTTCTTDCELSNDPNVEYQDFTVLNPRKASGIRIQIDSWYGQGGGLSNVQIFQSDIAVYAHTGAAESSTNSCASTPSPSSSTTGNWEERFVYGPYQNFMTTTFPASELATSNASITYSPYVPVQGQYSVYATTPGCVGSSTCNERTQVDLTLQLVPGGQSTTVTIDQNNYEDMNTLIYNGFVAGSNAAFQPTITLSVAHNATASGSTVSIVASSIQFIRNGTNATLVSILEYSPSNFTQNITPAWRPLAEQLAPGSIVRSIDASIGNILYIGGQFSGLNSTYRGVVSYDYSQGNRGGALVPLNGGVNGTVYDLTLIRSSLFVAGAFNGTLTDSPGSFNNLAQFDTSSSTWSSIGMGVDGPATKVLPSADNSTVTFSGNFTHIVHQSQQRSTTTATSLNTPSFENAIWNITENQWVQPKSLLVGQLMSLHSMNETTEILAGGIRGAQTYRADNAAVMDSHQIWSPYIFPYLPSTNNNIHTGVFWHNVTSDGQNKTVVIIGGGPFTISNNNQNTSIALYQDGQWKGLGDLQGQVYSLYILKDTLYIGGHFQGTIGTTQVTSFAIYDLKQQQALDVGSVYGSQQGGSPGTVNVIQSQPDGNAIFIGGDFAFVGSSMHCSSICKLDTQTRQWNQVAPGITGQVRDIAVANNQVTVVGDIAVDSNPTFAAQVSQDGSSSSSNSWVVMSASDAVTGTATAVLNGPSDVIVAGSNGSAGYIGTWDGRQFSNIANLGPSSNIRQMLFMPIQESPSNARYPPDTENMLLLVGHLELQEYGNVSSALFDGHDWFPYTMSTKYDGAPGQLQQIFHETRCCTITDIIHHLPVPAVILISIAISLGLIFVLVGAGLLALFAKRRNNVKDTPEPMPPYIPGQNRPSSLVAMLDAAQAGTLGAGAAAAIAGAGTAAAAGPSNEKALDQSTAPLPDPSGSQVPPGTITAFGALMAAAIGNTSEVASDDNPRLYYAKYPFDAKEYGELGFDTNTPIVVTDTSDNVWWMGYKDDGSGNPISGLFPSNYVTETKPSS